MVSNCSVIAIIYVLSINREHSKGPVTEFSVSICSAPKFVCSSDDGIPRLLITEIDNNSCNRALKKQDGVNITSL